MFPKSEQLTFFESDNLPTRSDVHTSRRMSKRNNMKRKRCSENLEDSPPSKKPRGPRGPYLRWAMNNEPMPRTTKYNRKTVSSAPDSTRLVVLNQLFTITFFHTSNCYICLNRKRKNQATGENNISKRHSKKLPKAVAFAKVSK